MDIQQSLNIKKQTIEEVKSKIDKVDQNDNETNIIYLKDKIGSFQEKIYTIDKKTQDHE